MKTTSSYHIVDTTCDYEHYDVYGHVFRVYTFQFPWSSRAEYLHFRNEWKKAHRQLSSLIRKAKRAFRHRYREESGMDRWRALWREITSYCSDHELVCPVLENDTLVWPLKAHARFLLQLRQAAKLHAQSMWESRQRPYAVSIQMASAGTD